MGQRSIFESDSKTTQVVDWLVPGRLDDRKARGRPQRATSPVPSAWRITPAAFRGISPHNTRPLRPACLPPRLRACGSLRIRNSCDLSGTFQERNRARPQGSPRLLPLGSTCSSRLRYYRFACGFLPDHPSADWTLQQLHSVFGEEGGHRYLIHDRDQIFGIAGGESKGQFDL